MIRFRFSLCLVCIPNICQRLREPVHRAEHNDGYRISGHNSSRGSIFGKFTANVGRVSDWTAHRGSVLLYIIRVQVKVVHQPTVHLRALLHKPPPRIGAPSPTKTVQLQCGAVSKCKAPRRFSRLREITVTFAIQEVRHVLPHSHAARTDYTDLIERDYDYDSLTHPSARVELDKARETRAALEKLVEGKIAAARPRHAPGQKSGEPTYVRYTPAQQNSQFNSGAKSRIIKLHEMPVDPLDPPRFRHKKLPGGPPSPPVPVMHSPPRKVTVQDQQNWKIPPCISNWKNIKGYTIPLDKRLASDGRGLQEKTINENFAKLSESLYIAERTARQEVEERAKIRTRLSRKKKLAKERELQDMARAAREKRAESAMQQRDTEAYADAETKEQAEARLSREDLRKDRMRDRRREYRMEDRSKSKRKGMGDRNKERDVSEKIALGQHVGRSKDSLYDQRLFNQDQGMSAGFRGEESYDIYDKPLFKST
eukprot:129479_1